MTIVQRSTYHIASFAVAALLAKCLPRIQARVESWSRPRGVQLHCEKERDISIVLSKQDTIEALDDLNHRYGTEMMSVKVPRKRPFFCKCADSALAGVV